MPLLIQRFHLTSITDDIYSWGFCVTVTTNTPCHLYLRYSDVFPRIHAAQGERRGFTMWAEVYHCFVAYHHIEQNEEGDTHTHTFNWPGWLYCETRYFYFFGHKGYLEMVSDSPIFWLHYDWIPTPFYDSLAIYEPPPQRWYFSESWDWLCQSFRVLNDSNIHYVKIQHCTLLGVCAGHGRYTLHQGNIDHPQGAALWEIDFPTSESYGGSTKPVWKPVEPPVPAIAGTWYWLTLKYFDDGGGMPYYLKSQKGDDLDFPSRQHRWLVGDPGTWHPTNPWTWSIEFTIHGFPV